MFLPKSEYCTECGGYHPVFLEGCPYYKDNDNNFLVIPYIYEATNNTKHEVVSNKLLRVEEVIELFNKKGVFNIVELKGIFKI